MHYYNITERYFKLSKGIAPSGESKKRDFREKVARRTRLELATPGVTGRYSNQLNYRRATKKVMVVATRLELVTSTL